jgi:hypothetical protein
MEGDVGMGVSDRTAGRSFLVEDGFLAGGCEESQDEDGNVVFHCLIVFFGGASLEILFIIII